MSFPTEKSVKEKPLYYQSYLKYRELVGWILHEDWMEFDGSQGFRSVASRERLYCNDLNNS